MSYADRVAELVQQSKALKSRGQFQESRSALNDAIDMLRRFGGAPRGSSGAQPLKRSGLPRGLWKLWGVAHYQLAATAMMQAEQHGVRTDDKGGGGGGGGDDDPDNQAALTALQLKCGVEAAAEAERAYRDAGLGDYLRDATVARKSLEETSAQRETQVEEWREIDHLDALGPQGPGGADAAAAYPTAAAKLAEIAKLDTEPSLFLEESAVAADAWERARSVVGALDWRCMENKFFCLLDRMGDAELDETLLQAEQEVLGRGGLLRGGVAARLLQALPTQRKRARHLALLVRGAQKHMADAGDEELIDPAEVPPACPWECAACGAPEAPKRCARCRQVRYCSAGCAAEHWKRAHKAECSPAPPDLCDVRPALKLSAVDRADSDAFRAQCAAPPLAELRRPVEHFYLDPCALSPIGAAKEACRASGEAAPKRGFAVELMLGLKCNKQFPSLRRGKWHSPQGGGASWEPTCPLATFLTGPFVKVGAEDVDNFRKYHSDNDDERFDYPPSDFLLACPGCHEHVPDKSWAFLSHEYFSAETKAVAAVLAQASLQAARGEAVSPLPGRLDMHEQRNKVMPRLWCVRCVRDVIEPLHTAEKAAHGLENPPVGNGTGGEWPFWLPTAWHGGRPRWGLGRGRQFLVHDLPSLSDAVSAWMPGWASRAPCMSRGRRHNLDHLYLCMSKINAKNLGGVVIRGDAPGANNCVNYGCGHCGSAWMKLNLCRPGGPATNPAVLQKCSACKLAWYCSRACQKAAWPAHKAACRKAPSSVLTTTTTTTSSSATPN